MNGGCASLTRPARDLTWGMAGALALTRPARDLIWELAGALALTRPTVNAMPCVM